MHALCMHMAITAHPVLKAGLFVHVHDSSHLCRMAALCVLLRYTLSQLGLVYAFQPVRRRAERRVLSLPWLLLWQGSKLAQLCQQSSMPAASWV